MARTSHTADKFPCSRAPRVGIATKTPQRNRGGIRRAVATRNYGQEMYLTTPERNPAVKGELYFDAARMGGLESLRGLCGRNDVTRIFTLEDTKFRV